MAGCGWSAAMHGLPRLKWRISANLRLRMGVQRVIRGARRPPTQSPNEKWGRPCGRPHSRRLVDPEGYLAARRLDAGSEKLLRAFKVGFHSPGARAGAGSVGGRNRSRGSTPCRPAVPRPHVVDLYLKRLSLCPKALRNPRFKPANPAFPILRPRGLNGLGFGLHQDEPLCVPLLIPPPRGFRHRVSAVPKSLLPRRSFDLCLGRANPRFDGLKVRAATDSGKRGTVHLSTFGLNASGQRWITQRFVAETPIYPRSRWPSSRSRPLFSDPAAPRGAVAAR